MFVFGNIKILQKTVMASLCTETQFSTGFKNVNFYKEIKQ